MADTITDRFDLVKPEQGASADDWGGKLNQNFDTLDAVILPRSGADAGGARLPMTGPLTLAEGTAGAPALAFSGDEDSGLYWISNNNLGMALGGSLAYQFGSAAFAPSRIVICQPSHAGQASLRIPAGAAPAAPVNGDLWSDGGGLYVRIAGATYDLTDNGSATTADRWTTPRKIEFAGAVSGATPTFNGSADVTATLSLASGAVDTAQLKTDAVTEAKLANGAATNAKLADMASGRLKGRVSANPGAPEDLTAAQALALLGIDTSTRGSSYVKLGDIYVMWGSTSTPSTDAQVNVNVPVSLPSGVVASAMAIIKNTDGSFNRNVVVQYIGSFGGTISFYVNQMDGSSSLGFQWFAIGW